MVREVIILAISLVFIGILDLVAAGYTSYMKPPKYWYYKQQPPLSVYPKLKYHHPDDALNEIQLYRLAALYKNPLKYTKHIRLVDKLKPGLVLGDHILAGDKNYGVNGWLTDGEHVKFSKPVFGFGSPAHYYAGGQLHQPHHRHQHTDSDIKPVMEHIENDLKYDFRTKTHSYR